MYCRHCGEEGFHFCEVKGRYLSPTADSRDFTDGSRTGGILTSAAIGAVTGSAILGAVLGGSITGGILGDALQGDGVFDED